MDDEQILYEYELIPLRKIPGDIAAADPADAMKVWFAVYEVLARNNVSQEIIEECSNIVEALILSRNKRS